MKHLTAELHKAHFGILCNRCSHYIQVRESALRAACLQPRSRACPISLSDCAQTCHQLGGTSAIGWSSECFRNFTTTAETNCWMFVNTAGAWVMFWNSTAC